MTKLERDFERHVIKKLEYLFPGAITLKVYPNYIQGFPDRLMLFENTWGAFEFKRTKHSHRQPNQSYYIDYLNKMSYASFIYPENEEVFFNEIQSTLRSLQRS